MQCPSCGTNWSDGETYCSIWDIDMTLRKRRSKNRKKKQTRRKREPSVASTILKRVFLLGAMLFGGLIGFLVLIVVVSTAAPDSATAYDQGYFFGKIASYLLFGALGLFVLRKLFFG